MDVLLTVLCTNDWLNPTSALTESNAALSYKKQKQNRCRSLLANLLALIQYNPGQTSSLEVLYSS